MQYPDHLGTDRRDRWPDRGDRCLRHPRHHQDDRADHARAGPLVRRPRWRVRSTGAGVPEPRRRPPAADRHLLDLPAAADPADRDLQQPLQGAGPDPGDRRDAGRKPGVRAAPHLRGHCPGRVNARAGLPRHPHRRAARDDADLRDARQGPRGAGPRVRADRRGRRRRVHHRV